MILTLLLCALAVVTAGFVIALVKAAIARRIGFPSGEALALGAVTNFFDTLGIGSFAPTMAWINFRSMVADRIIPSTMLAGYALQPWRRPGFFWCCWG